MKIEVAKKDGIISVKSPYDENFISRARQTSGKWNRDEKAWEFDQAYEDVVKKILAEIYGYEAESKHSYNFFIKINKEFRGDEIKISGQKMVKRAGRDCSVRLYNCALIEGSFSESGGSKRHPMIIDRYESEKIIKVVGFSYKPINPYSKGVEIFNITTNT